MNVDELKNSRFLRKEDSDPPIYPTIDHVEKQNVAGMGERPENKWCLFFVEEHIKPMVLNSRNGQLIARFLGSKDTETWTGKRIKLINDPSVTFGSEVVGGIRARSANGQVSRPTKPHRPVQINEPISADDVSGEVDEDNIPVLTRT